MKAVRYHTYGDSDVLVFEEAEEPKAAAGQVVLRVAGAAFNPVDVAIRSGGFSRFLPLAFPQTPGIDVSGVITELGEGVTGWNVGDAVIAFLAMDGPGAAAEYTAVPADALVAAPEALPLADASALPTVGLTARQGLFEHAGLQAGQRLLINGAGGGVGGIAVQLAKRAGAEVTATAGARSAARVRAAGADRIVDYTAVPVEEALAGERFGAVFHLVRNSPEEAARLVDLVADGGVFVSAATPGPEQAERGVRVTQMYMRGDAAELGEVVALVDAGELTLHVAERLPLAELRAVHERAVAGTLAGKTVLVP
ncbi:NADP-dependent oxidoreductase [Glycomyces sp. TRM65418]|uniref:NADP-dependent oxidoreductase n=1 Tax=Glycomyces sp. TRM65418 TaxID=2867006 RepID=UPI001CE63342|nr:NADP-dependent oxidoreductase [Glycomyces sp. TRM65418]MCC3765222.1 NADP-dependent oxidoreductase [Glycomyces sp. TRM65418]QZD54847.1 NADP-dependent oxidoreductase [Glycomyces sp. TRM65418]